MLPGKAFFEWGHVTYPHRQILWAIWLSALLLSLLVSWQVANLTREDYQRQFTTAVRDLTNLTLVSQEHANRTLRSADQVIRFVQASYLKMGDKLDLTMIAREGVLDSEIFNQVGIIDSNGVYALTSLPLHDKLDLSDRDHFKVQSAQNTNELFVSKPLFSRTTGEWSIQLTRRIDLAQGRFGGVVVLSLDPRYFTQFYGELDLGTKGVMALYGLDGVSRARRSGQKEEFGTHAATSVMFDRLREGQLEGSFTERSEVDGVQRLYYFRKLAKYPLVVVAGLDIDEVLANHFKTRDVLRWQALIMIALILLLAVALTRFLLNLRRAIEARIKAQNESQERSVQLDAIFALSPDGFISFDAQWHISFVNPAFYQMVGLDQRRLDGLSEQEFSLWLAERCVAGPAFPGVAAMRAGSAAGKQDDRKQMRLQMLDKKVLLVELRCNQSGPVSQVLYFRDITIETEVDAMKSEFMATAAHELRTPMTSILGFTELLLSQDHEPAAQREFLTIVFECSQLMARVLDDLLDLARIEARRGRDFRYSGIDVQKLVTGVAQSLRLAADCCPPVLRFPSALPILMADSSKLKQAIANVLSNAYKYARPNVPNVVSVSVSLKDSSDGEQQLCIVVTDTGIGMTPEQASRIYERFYRADASGKVAGTGLGMSIVKEIVELHHGEVKVVSALGRGTSVCLCLPMKTSDSQVE